MRVLVALVTLLFAALAAAENPECRYVQTTFPTCNTTCTATCTEPVCTTVCVQNECTAKPRCEHDCTGAVYDNTTCPDCPLACEPLACHVEDDCTPNCDLGNCSWACKPVASTLCRYPRFELQCDPTYCEETAGASLPLIASLLLALLA